MDILNSFKGYTIYIVQSSFKNNQTVRSLRYFALDFEKNIYMTTNFSLYQHIFDISYSYEDYIRNLSASCKKYQIEKVLGITQIQEHTQPELLPFYNKKNFKIQMQLISLEKDVSENEKQFIGDFIIFGFNDWYLQNLLNYFKNFEKIQQDKNETLIQVENYFLKRLKQEYMKEEQQINDYMQKYNEENYMIINKIQQDEINRQNKIEIQSRQVVSQEEVILNNELTSVYVLNNGSRYIGELVDNKPNGQGQEIINNNMQYVGGFLNGLWHGIGYLKDSNNIINHGEFYEDKLIAI